MTVINVSVAVAEHSPARSHWNSVLVPLCVPTCSNTCSDSVLVLAGTLDFKQDLEAAIIFSTGLELDFKQPQAYGGRRAVEV